MDKFMVPILAIVIVHSDSLEHVGPVLQTVPELPILGVSPAVQLCGEACLGDRELMESVLSHEGAHGDIRSWLKRWRMMPNLGHDPKIIRYGRTLISMSFLTHMLFLLFVYTFLYLWGAFGDGLLSVLCQWERRLQEWGVLFLPCL